MIIRPKTAVHPWMCDRCGKPPLLFPVTPEVPDAEALNDCALLPCPDCLFALCIDCMLAHLTTEQEICHEVEIAACMHAAMRLSEQPNVVLFRIPETMSDVEDEDLDYAHRVALPRLWRGPIEQYLRSPFYRST